VFLFLWVASMGLVTFYQRCQLSEVTAMAKPRVKQPQHNNQFSGLLWKSAQAWKGCFCTVDEPNAKPNASIRGESVKELSVIADETGEAIGTIRLQNIANPTTALVATGVFEGLAERVGLAVFFDELNGRFRIARQRPRPELV